MNPTPMCVPCGFVYITEDKLVHNRERNVLQCPWCGASIVDLAKREEAVLLKLAEHNRVAVQSFSIVEAPSHLHQDQYFVMWGMAEGENFRPDRICGIWEAAELSGVMAYYRETGVLRLRKYSVPPWSDERYEYIQPLWVYFLSTEAMMHKMNGYNEIPLPKEDECNAR